MSPRDQRHINSFKTSLEKNTFEKKDTGVDDSFDSTADTL